MTDKDKFDRFSAEVCITMLTEENWQVQFAKTFGFELVDIVADMFKARRLHGDDWNDHFLLLLKDRIDAKWVQRTTGQDLPAST